MKCDGGLQLPVVASAVARLTCYSERGASLAGLSAARHNRQLHPRGSRGLCVGD